MGLIDRNTVSLLLKYFSYANLQTLNLRGGKTMDLNILLF
jgi:hypothetical protein